MASDNQPLTLMNIPLEVRHQVFGYVAIRDTQPQQLLRYWFEKQEVKEKTAGLAAQNPTAEAPRVVLEGDECQYDEEYKEDGSENEEGENDGEGDSDEEDEHEDENEDEGDSEEEIEEGGEGDDEEEGKDEAEEQNAEMDGAGNTTVTTAPTPGSAAPDQSLIHTLHDLTAAMTAVNATAQASATTAPESTSTVAQRHAQMTAESEHSENEGVDEDMSDIDAKHHEASNGTDTEEDDNDDDVENQDGNEVDDGDGDSANEDVMTEQDGCANTVAQVAQPPPPAPLVTTHRKWRHIPQVRVTRLFHVLRTFMPLSEVEWEEFTDWMRPQQFMRITHCPPPVELLLTSKQLNTEAKSWFYDVAVLHIEATGSFAHTSFFEEAFSQITEAAFSPMGDIRKVEVTFVWDTTWLRSEQAGYANVIFPALLRQRALFVVGILAQAPNLSNVTIHWHDSVQDDESVDLMNDVLMGFLGLNAEVKVETHYIAPDAKPYKRSIAGRRRTEFQDIVDNGLDRLF